MFRESEIVHRMDSIPVMLLFGQTAIGKTGGLYNLFSSFSPLSLLSGCAEIVGADSVQVYADAKVCTASPTDSVLSSLKHHLVACKTPFEEFSVSDFVNEADKLVSSIYKRHMLPVIAGGTGFFIKNFIYGLPSTPTAKTETRQLLQQRLENEGIASLYAELKRIDMKTAARLNINDEYRILRALEVFYDSGKVLSSFPLSDEPRSLYDFLPIYLTKNRSSIYQKIETRIDEMQSELKSEFLSIYHLCRDRGITPNLENVPLFRAIGFREFFEIDSQAPENVSLCDVIPLMKRNTKRYAKRQETFFKQIAGSIKIDMDQEGWYGTLHKIVVQFYEKYF